MTSQYSRQLASISEIARSINSSTDLNATLNRIVRALCMHTSWSSSAIMVVRREEGVSELVTTFDGAPGAVPPSCTRWTLKESATLAVIERGTPVVIRDAQSTKRFRAYVEDAAKRNYHTVVVLPLGCTDVLGREMTVAVHSRDVVTVGKKELDFLETIVQLASIAVDKAKRINDVHVLAGQLRRSFDVTSSLMSRVLDDAPLEELLDTVSDIVPKPLALISFVEGRVWARDTPLPSIFSEHEWGSYLTELSTSIVESAIRSADQDAVQTYHELVVPHKESQKCLTCVIEPFHVNRELVGGLIVFVTDGALSDIERVAARTSRLALNVCIMRRYIRLRSEGRSIADFFNDLLQGTGPVSLDLTMRAKQLGIDLSVPAFLFTIEGSDRRQLQSKGGYGTTLELSLSRILERHISGGALITHRGSLLLLVPDEPNVSLSARKTALNEIIGIVKRVTGDNPIVAQSALCTEAAHYRTAREECERIMTLGRLFDRTGVLVSNDFGPFSVLFSAFDSEEALSFVENTLGPIEEYDRRHGSGLTETLFEFIESGGRYQTCARQLHVHVSTLRYRLGRLKDLFNLDLEDRDVCFSISLAMRLKQLGAR